MSLTWVPRTPAVPRDRVSDPASAPAPERLRLCIALPVLLGASALVWGGIGLAIAWLLG